MIQPVIRNASFLAQPSTEASVQDALIAQDLLDTLAAHEDECVGMAANMIGVQKRIIAFIDGNTPCAMLNPELVSQAGAYETEEGCLSLVGKRPCTRYKTIKVRWVDLKGNQRSKSFKGWTAQIIQHEIDHCNGIVI
jgi:peptide deformylase